MALTFALPAQAGFKLRVSDHAGGASGWQVREVVADNASSDLSPENGVLVYSHVETGASGLLVYELELTVGTSQSAAASPNSPRMQLGSLRITTHVDWTGTLKIELTDTGFSGPPGALGATDFLMSVNGASTGDVHFASYVDASNAEFGASTPLVDYGFDGGFFGNDFAFSDVRGAPVDSSYSATLVATIAHDRAPGVTLFTADLSTISALPEPASAWVWLALAALGGVGWRVARGKTLRRDAEG